MAVGKGSLNRVVAKSKKSEIVTLLPNNVVDVEISAIKFSPIKENSLMDESVKAYGVILPVIVAEVDGGLKLIDGAKRLTALKKLGVKTVKAVVLKESKDVSKELKKFEKPEKVVEKIVEKVVEKVVVKKPTKTKKDDICEEKFSVIKRLGEEEMPVYLL
ncbi:MAG: ParB-like nuclease domain-containing protein [Clostridia bacterium]|nr:ParB-like nuclease domain-containing protein [Clostridia bacterium]